MLHALNTSLPSSAITTSIILVTMISSIVTSRI